MEQELSVHLIGMFHARFGTNGKGNGNGRSFNPFAKDHQNPIQMSLLVQSILLAGKASGPHKAKDLSRLDLAEMKGKNVMRLLAKFMEPFG